MEYSVKQAVRECHYGERERDCDRCPAHHSRAHMHQGSDDEYVCCFGTDKHDPYDTVCQNCIHKEDCEEELRESQSRVYQTPSTYRGGSSVKRTIVSRHGRKSLPIYGQSSAAARYRHDEDDDDEVTEVIQHQRDSRVERIEVDHMPLAKQVGVHAAWGAAEGALGMVLNFFQNRRPR